MADQNNTPHHQLSQAVDREVRQLLGDLQMQVVVLRQMLELAQRPAAGGQPQPTPQPTPTPPVEQPVPQPDPQPVPRQHAVNGRAKEA